MRFQRFIPILVALCIFLSPEIASAQTDGEVLTTIYLTVIFAPAGVGITLAGVTTTGGVVAGIMLTDNDKESRETREIQAYLRENRHHLLQDMAVGGGDALDDLATLFGVSPAYLPLFERALLMERARLTSLLSGDDVSLDDSLMCIEVIATRITVELEHEAGGSHTHDEKMRRMH